MASSATTEAKDTPHVRTCGERHHSLFGELPLDTNERNVLLLMYHESWAGTDLHLNKQASSMVLRALFNYSGLEQSINRCVNKCNHCKTSRFDPEKHKVNLDWKLTPLDFKQFFHKNTIKEICTSTNSQSVKLAARNCIGSYKQDTSIVLNPEEIHALQTLAKELKEIVLVCFEKMHKNKKRESIETDISLTTLTEVTRAIMGNSKLNKDTSETFTVLVRSLLLKDFTQRRPDQAARDGLSATNDRKGARRKRNRKKGSAVESPEKSANSKTRDDTATKVVIDEAEKSAGDNVQLLDSGNDQGARKPEDNTKSTCKDETNSKTRVDAATKVVIDEAEKSAGDNVQPLDRGKDQEARKPEVNTKSTSKDETNSKPRSDAATKVVIDEAEKSAEDNVQPLDSGKDQEARKPEVKTKSTSKDETVNSSTSECSSCVAAATPESISDPRLDDSGREITHDPTGLSQKPKHCKTASEVERRAEAVIEGKRPGKSETKIQYDSEVPPEHLHSDVLLQASDHLSISCITKQVTQVALFTLLTTQVKRNTGDMVHLTLRHLPEEEGVTYNDYFMAVFHFPIPETSYIYHVILDVHKPTWRTNAVHSHVSTTQASTLDRDLIKMSVDKSFRIIDMEHRERAMKNPEKEIRTRIVLPFSNCGLAGIRRDVTADHEIVVVPDGLVDYYLGHVVYVIKHIVETAPLSDYWVDSYRYFLDNCVVAAVESFNEKSATKE